jgi:glucose-6-phosphate isomerase
LGEHSDAVNKALQEAQRANVVERIWRHDASLWKSESAHQKIITNSLGWLTVAGEMLEVAGELRTFADEIASAGYQYAMVCGMGGSSLCPEVLRQTFGKQTNYPELLVLDSTDPDTVNSFNEQIDLERSLFLIASKSGTTTEPNAFLQYWWEVVCQVTDVPGQAFVTITDPGSQMADTAAADSFRRIFLNQPTIGGRYSALSYFGMVPAALMGLDVRELLQRANAMSEACGANVEATRNPGAQLGAVMAESAIAGRDKLTIVTDEKLSALGLWIEQLIAESTGKEGKGIVPVGGESLAGPDAYDNDRLFVSVSVGNVGEETSRKLKALEAADHPVVYRTLHDVYDLGAEFFLWEMATAFAGWRLGINPFDQPNVQESKDATKQLLEKFKTAGKLEQETAIASEGEITLYGSDEKSDSLKAALKAYRSRIKKGDYVALLAYLQETPETDAELAEIRKTIRAATRCATTTGYGPRFLHSTGQLHKGGPDSGVFFQITSRDAVDLTVPGEPYTFGILKDAQALGDFQSLQKHGRRALRVDLGHDERTGLQKFGTLLKEVLSA